MGTRPPTRPLRFTFRSDTAKIGPSPRLRLNSPFDLSGSRMSCFYEWQDWNTVHFMPSKSGRAFHSFRVSLSLFNHLTGPRLFILFPL